MAYLYKKILKFFKNLFSPDFKISLQIGQIG